MLYDHPDYYDVAFGFRDIEAEAAFMDEAIKRFSTTSVRRVLEVACGPAPHAGELDRLGYSYVGVDINPRMLSHAREKWQHLGHPIRLELGNLFDHRLARPADFAFVMLGSLYLSNTQQMDEHFDTMAHNLKSGALYFLDWCIQFHDPLGIQANQPVRTTRDGIEVESRFKIRLLDPGQNVFEEIWTVNVDDHGKKEEFTMVERNKAIFPGEFRQFLEARRDFEFVGWWRDWDFSQPIKSGGNIPRPLAIIRRA